MDLEAVDDVLLWWYEHHNSYPRLSYMALDYLTIPDMPLSRFCVSSINSIFPATSVDVEHLYSRNFDWSVTFSIHYFVVL